MSWLCFYFCEVELRCKAGIDSITWCKCPAKSWLDQCKKNATSQVCARILDEVRWPPLGSALSWQGTVLSCSNRREILVNKLKLALRVCFFFFFSDSDTGTSGGSDVIEQLVRPLETRNERWKKKCRTVYSFFSCSCLLFFFSLSLSSVHLVLSVWFAWGSWRQAMCVFKRRWDLNQELEFLFHLWQ